MSSVVSPGRSSAVLLPPVGVSVSVHVSPGGGVAGRSNCSVVYGTTPPSVEGVPAIVA